MQGKSLNDQIGIIPLLYLNVICDSNDISFGIRYKISFSLWQAYFKKFLRDEANWKNCKLFALQEFFSRKMLFQT